MDIERYKRIENKYLFEVDIRNQNCNVSLYNALNINIRCIFFGPNCGRDTEPLIDKLNIKNYGDVLNIDVYGHMTQQTLLRWEGPKKTNWHIESSTPFTKDTTINDILKDLQVAIQNKKHNIDVYHPEIFQMKPFKENCQDYTAWLYDVFLERIKLVMKGEPIWN